MNFKKLELEDINLIRPFFTMQSSRICDNTVGTVIMWRDSFDTHYAIKDGSLFFRVLYGSKRETAYTMPLGFHKKQALEQLKEYFEQTGEPILFCTIAKTDLSILQEVFGDFEIAADRDSFDYLYKATDLITFKGRRYNGQRNHMNRFMRNYPDYKFIEINSSNTDRVYEFFKVFVEKHLKESRSAKEEAAHVFEVLENYELYDFFGAFLEVEGKIIAFSLGEKVNDTLFVHIEKARTDYYGTYQMMVNQFAGHFSSPEIVYINREDDMGDEGLRKSKLSYHPVELIEKYTLRKNGIKKEE